MSRTFLCATQKKVLAIAKETKWSLCDPLRFYTKEAEATASVREPSVRDERCVGNKKRHPPR